MRRVYLLIMVLVATAAGVSLSGWTPHAAGGAASAPVETPQRAAAQQDCVDDVSVTMSSEWGVVDRNNNYVLKDPPDYKAVDDIGIYYAVTNSSCGEVTVTVALTGSVSGETIHDADGSQAPCLERCTLESGPESPGWRE